MDYEELSGALDESLRLCHSVNEAVRSKENTEQLEWLQTNVQFSLDEVKYYTVEQIHIFLLASVLEKLHLYHIQYEEKRNYRLALFAHHPHIQYYHICSFFLFLSLFSRHWCSTRRPISWANASCCTGGNCSRCSGTPE